MWSSVVFLATFFNNFIFTFFCLDRYAQISSSDSFLPRSCALAETNDLLNTTQMLQPQTGGGAGKSWDETLTELASDIAERIPGPYDIEVALLDFPVLYEEVRTTFRWTTACAVFYCFFIYLQLRLS